jgi:segregation and condensation protein A
LSRPGHNWTIRTDIFEGPIDLLLHLIDKKGIDISELQLVIIADAYLEYLSKLQELNLEIAADYLVMAAKLCHLKSLELLPRQPDNLAAEEDPREQLIAQLKEAQQLKELAKQLGALPQLGRDAFARNPMDSHTQDDDRPVVANVNSFGLLELYVGMLTRLEQDEPIFEVGGEGIDLATCVRTVLNHLGGKGRMAQLDHLLEQLGSRLERVMTFLAVLEMARLQWVSVSQQVHLGPVELVCKVDKDVDFSRLVGTAVVKAAS